MTSEQLELERKILELIELSQHLSYSDIQGIAQAIAITTIN